MKAAKKQAWGLLKSWITLTAAETRIETFKANQELHSQGQIQPGSLAGGGDFSNIW